jgi:CheY-like chemotaxis protein
MLKTGWSDPFDIVSTVATTAGLGKLLVTTIAELLAVQDRQLDPQNWVLQNRRQGSTVVRQDLNNRRIVVVAEQFVDDGPDASASPDLPLRVLHIEDDLALAEMYALGLELQGFEVVRAGDGVAGVQAASTDGPDFVVLDIDLPLLDGLQVLALLRQDPRTAGLPAVLLSGCNPSDYRQRAAALGVEGVLLKSETTPRKLGDAIRRRLAGSP